MSSMLGRKPRYFSMTSLLCEQWLIAVEAVTGISLR